MAGYEAMVQIRESGVRLPIIAITAYALKGDMERSLGKGADDYIAKPVNRQLLMTKLLKWLVSPAAAPTASGFFPRPTSPSNAILLLLQSAQAGRYARQSGRAHGGGFTSDHSISTIARVGGSAQSCGIADGYGLASGLSHHYSIWRRAYIDSDDTA